MVETIEVEAESLEEAKKQIRSQIPAGQSLVSEKVLSDGSPKDVKVVGKTTEEAFAEARTQIPASAVVLDERIVAYPEVKTFRVEAFDEPSAKKKALGKSRSAATLKSLNLLSPGRKGFWGLGKKPGVYNVELSFPAIVEITYKAKAKIKAKAAFKDRGDRQDDLSQAVAYWMRRMTSPQKDPFILYTFKEATNAREALLELPCIHEGQDGKLVCTEYLVFGYYQQSDGKYEAILCGDELTYPLWEAAQASFEKHGGTRKNALEPEKKPSDVAPRKKAEPNAVVFVREDRVPSKLGTGTAIYRIYQGPNAESARAFLEKNPVTEELFYIVVETPEGNFGRDIQGMYKE